MKNNLQKAGIACLCLLFPMLGSAQSAEPENTPSQWVETSKINLPPMPKAESLLPFDIGPSMNIKPFIDSVSLSADTDGVVRYVLITENTAGKRNLSYEGIRCGGASRRVYAVATWGDETWREINMSWQPMEQFYIQRTLAHDFFCDGKYMIRPASKLIERIKYPARVPDGWRDHP